MLKYKDLINRAQNIFIYNKITVLLVTLTSLIVAIFIWNGSKNHYDSIVQNKFETAVNENVISIQRRMSKYQNILQSGIGLFYASENVTREEWHSFIRAIDIKKNYPGMQGVGFTKMIAPEEVVRTEQEIRREGFASFKIRPEGKRDIYSSIIYLEPMDRRNMQAIGYDMFSEPTRKKAMETARDTGIASMSGKVTLVQEIDEDVQPGMLIYLPLYKKGAITDTVQARRDALIGFVYSPFRMNDLMNKIVPESSILNFEIYDSDNISEDNLLYRSYGSLSYNSKYHTSRELKIDNFTWYIRFHSTKEFDDSMDSSYPLLITTIGLSIQLFLVYMILMLFKSREMLKHQANELLKLSQALEQSPSSILITDLKGNIEYANKAFCQITGYSKDEIIGKNPRFLKSGKTESKLFAQMWKNLSNGKTWEGEFINKTKGKEEYIESIKAAPIFQPDGAISNYVAIKEDITEKKHSEEQIYYLANYDPLTGLPNRFQLKERLRHTIHAAKRNGEIFTIIFLDLDHFKDINDTLGHDAGDVLLVELSKRFRSILRRVDTASRLGGDEFIFLLPNTDKDGASHIALKLLDIIDKPVDYQDNELLVTASIGIAIYPKDGEDQKTLFKNADSAMYKAKKEGRNKYRFF